MAPPPSPTPSDLGPDVGTDVAAQESTSASTQSPAGRIGLQLNAPAEYVPGWIPTADRFPRQSVKSKNGLPEEPRVSQVDLQVDEDEEDVDQIRGAIDAAPPWLISLLVHMALIVILGLIALSQNVLPSINLEASFSESLGEQLEHESFEIADTHIDDEPLITPADVTAVEDPLASPHNEAPELPSQLLATSTFDAPNIGLALSGREQGMKETLLLAYGGSETTELAVEAALKWLAKNQGRSGAWRLDGPYADGSVVTNPLAATSMALLAFQGAGFTHSRTRMMMSTKDGTKREVDYRNVVRRGWDKMLSWQAKDGNFWQKGGVDHPHHKLYSHAQATIAICELYAMTKDPEFRRPAQLAVNYACDIQDEDGIHPDGGWKYDPGQDSDTSVTGWFVMALQSARMAGLDVPSDVFEKVSKFLDSVTDDGSFYAYMPGYASKPALTAEALLCRQYMGWKRDDERLLEGAEYIAQNPIDWSDTNTYYWYYATQVMHHMEGDLWFDWNEVMAKQIPAKQVRSGPEAGSWSPDGDIWGQGGGRLYMTCLCTYMLEVYYRHLPIYSKLF